MGYLTLMSINSYLPSILLLSLTIGYLVYYLQSTCPIRATILPIPVTETVPVSPVVPAVANVPIAPVANVPIAPVANVPVGPSTITVNPA